MAGHRCATSQSIRMGTSSKPYVCVRVHVRLLPPQQCPSETPGRQPTSQGKPLHLAQRHAAATTPLHVQRCAALPPSCA
eukprot:CAMPEP_0202862276 /NCGR_PEP_ID=MMETSP1391-20130828/3377_1 /ASSEMBLY_ACC=CAM_ASM_000867 /TAXON_ID=1034604 /ORGANISM="Chlamydomonas leiostraca, Strain SAG 11-49" /LENGTH=78 /DNA_ID=CAMNT_0049541791 /DNA_START=56 /DNA_END=289 /DNA_ORIENTATION=-